MRSLGGPKGEALTRGLLSLKRDIRGLASFLSHVRTQGEGRRLNRLACWSWIYQCTKIAVQERYLPTLNLHFHLSVERLPHNYHHNYYHKLNKRWPTRQIRPKAIFGNEAYYILTMSILSCTVYGCIHVTKAELNSCNKNHMVCKA